MSDLITNQRKRRHLSLLTKVNSGKNLSKQEIDELAGYERAIELLASATKGAKDVKEVKSERKSPEIIAKVRRRPSGGKPATMDEKIVASLLLAMGHPQTVAAKAIGKDNETVNHWLKDQDFREKFLDPALLKVGVASRSFMLPRLNAIIEGLLTSVMEEVQDGIGKAMKETLIDPVTGAIIERRTAGVSLSQKVSAIERLHKIGLIILEKPTEYFGVKGPRASSANLETLLEAWRAAKKKDPLGTLLAEQESVKSLLIIAQERRRGPVA